MFIDPKVGRVRDEDVEIMERGVGSWIVMQRGGRSVSYLLNRRLNWVEWVTTRKYPPDTVFASRGEAEETFAAYVSKMQAREGERQAKVLRKLERSWREIDRQLETVKSMAADIQEHGPSDPNEILDHLRSMVLICKATLETVEEATNA
jgi:hypothetical protein